MFSPLSVHFRHIIDIEGDMYYQRGLNIITSLHFRCQKNSINSIVRIYFYSCNSYLFEVTGHNLVTGKSNLDLSIPTKL